MSTTATGCFTSMNGTSAKIRKSIPGAPCPKCGGLARIADAPCDHPGCEAGYVPVCLNCGVEPRDPLFAPLCSSACRDAWQVKEAKARLELGLPPLVTRAP